MVLLARHAHRMLPVRRPPVFRSPYAARQYSIGAVFAECSDAATYAALLPVSFMESIHATGLPWFAAIPLSAVLIRSLIVYPFLQRPLREKMVDRAQIQPLVDAGMSIERRRLSKNSFPVPGVKEVAMILHSWGQRADVQWKLFNRLPVSHRFMMFLTTVLVSDGLRRMMGAREGLLKFILGPLDWTLSWLLPTSLVEGDSGKPIENSSNASVPAPASTSTPVSASASSSTPVSASASNAATSQNHVELSESPEFAKNLVPSNATLHETVANMPISQDASQALAGHANSAWFDPSMVTEGFSWCPDLTMADPTFTLPVIFSGTFFASIYFSPRIAGAASANDGERAKPTNIQRIGMTLAMLSIIPASQMPAGLLLYFITNMATNNVQARWLAYTKPIYPAPTACSRPVRMQRSKEIAEDMLPNKASPALRRQG
ncbi:hypothetical protein E4T47_01298 [Aureobasidium subglaciale]|nr:hypothetical protein E4T47_01298 [Aureobasidium subglaciale]